MENIVLDKDKLTIIMIISGSRQIRQKPQLAKKRLYIRCQNYNAAMQTFCAMLYAQLPQCSDDT